MNKYDELYNFRKAKMNDVDRLMRFIRENWRANHILGNDREFFLYEHGNGDEINFIICESKKNGELVGMHGFIPYSWDEELRHVCGVMTMVKKDVFIPMLGVELIKRFIGIMQYKTYCGIGTNPKTMVPLVKRLFHRYVGKMEHYYRLNEKVEEFKIVKIVNRKKNCAESIERNQAELLELKDFTEVKKRFVLNKSNPFLPYKEDWYIEKRYFKHLIYQYRVWGIAVNGRIRALLFGRQVEQANTKILRFVDFIGDIEDLVFVNKGVKEIIEKDGYEYADFLLHGVPEKIMSKAGFVRKTEEEGNIIPNYFEPFIQNNVDIWFETSHEDMIIFRADADGDRPNMR
ncbi:MAG: hypothetical protein AAGU27_20140 [Dehalobacterium sp.]